MAKMVSFRGNPASEDRRLTYCGEVQARGVYIDHSDLDI
ncbi:MAG: hypothetical protein QOI88_3533 [Gammaproteobacteria bacterium]|jgi:hypothetical protein|nr:hypothetical protein [Gammaproteobacteria bacterium]